jgi:hypothetical protein
MSTKQFISTIFTAECVAGNTFDKGILIVDALLNAIPPEKLESALESVVDLSDIDLNELKSQLDNLTLDTVFPCSTKIDSNDIMVNELVKDIHTNNIPYAGVKSFLMTVEQHQTVKFLNRVDMTFISKYMFSKADFGSITVSSIGELVTECIGDQLKAQQIVYWTNYDPKSTVDIKGTFTVDITRDGLSLSASGNGAEISIMNYDDVIKSAANEFKIPQALLPKSN